MTYFIGNNLFNEFETCTLDECIEYLKTQSVIGLDIETSRAFPKGRYDESVYKPGLDPYLSRIIMIQVGTLEKRFVIDSRVIDCTPLKEILENESILKVGANLMFESLFFLHHFKCRILGLYDVLLVDRILNNGLYTSFSLESLMKRYLDYKPILVPTLFGEESLTDLIDKAYAQKVENWMLLHGVITEDIESILYEDAVEEVSDKYVDKSIRMQFVELGDKPFTIEMIKYGDTDIEAPLKLREIFLKGKQVFDGENVETYYPENAIKMENKLISVLAEMIYTGLHFDSLAWLELSKKNVNTYGKRKEFLDDYVTSNFPEFTGMLDLFTNKPECLIDWQSSKQVQKLFKKLDLTVMARSKSTGKMTETVGAKDLIRSLKNEFKVKFQKGLFPEQIEKPQDLVVAYLLFKQSQQVCTTYGKEFLRHVHPITGRIHCNIRQYLNTTRMAATRPNVLAIPRGEEFRKCFTAPQGYYMWACDYSSQEIVVMAEMFDNETLQEFFIEKQTNPSLDMHSWTATKVYQIVYNNPEFVCDKDVHKEERQRSKTVSFLIPYGGSPAALASEIGVEIEDAEKFMAIYYDSFPGLKEAFEKAKKQAMKRGWIQICPYTDKRYFFDKFDEMISLQSKAMSFYPKDYRTYTQEQKAEFKDNLYLEHPEVKQYWKQWSIYKGILERRSVNYKIQGSSATQTKASLIFMYNERYKSDSTEWMPVLAIHDECVGYSRNENCDNIKELLLKGARFNCKKTPVFAVMEVSDHWVH